MKDEVLQGSFLGGDFESVLEAESRGGTMSGLELRWRGVLLEQDILWEGGHDGFQRLDEQTFYRNRLPWVLPGRWGCLARLSLFLIHHVSPAPACPHDSTIMVPAEGPLTETSVNTTYLFQCSSS